MNKLCQQKIVIYSHPNTYTCLTDTCPSQHFSELIQSSQRLSDSPQVWTPSNSFSVRFLGDETKTTPNIFLLLAATRHPLTIVKNFLHVSQFRFIKDFARILLLLFRALLPSILLTAVFQHCCHASPCTRGYG